MKRLTLLLGIVVFFITNSCEVEKPERYFEIDGIRHDLSIGLMDNQGTNSTGVINSRRYNVSLRSSQDLPNHFITFFIASFGTEDLEQGNYYYDPIGDRGTFSDIRIGSNMRYAYDGSFNNGIVYAEKDFDIDGVLRISRSSKGNLDFFFDVDLVVKDTNSRDFPDSIYKLTGEYNDRLILDTYDVDLETY